MKQTTQPLSLLSQEQRQKAVKKVVDYYATERNETIGVIVAEDLLDMFLDVSGSELFNAGVEETKRLLQERLQGIDFEIDLLKKEG